MLDTIKMAYDGLDEAKILAFRQSLQGQLLRPWDAAYDEARRVWNGMIDRRPAFIARCEGVADVIASVNFARENNLLVAVRGGGHQVAGHATCDDGIVIDLSPMNGVFVDPVNRIARVQGGARLVDLDRETQAYGLATSVGVVSDTGVAGLTLGGGFGWLRNKYGLSCDNVIAAEVVTADGRLLRVSATENSDLFWSIRGGGGNFGIVTSFEFQLYPLGPEVMFAFVLHHGDKAVEGLRFFREYCATAPDEVSPIAVLGVVPPMPHFPQELHMTPYVLFAAAYAGPVDEGEKVLQPLRDFSQPILDFSGRMPFVQVQKVWDEDYPTGMRYYWKSLNLLSLTDEAIERIVDHAQRQPSPFSTVDLWHIGGAVKRISETENAFHGRHAAFLMNPEANWEAPSDDASNIAWARDMVAALEDFSDGSRYLNFAGFQEEGEAMMRAAFGDKYAKLVALKQKYDPTNLFKLNQNIKPTQS